MKKGWMAVVLLLVMTVLGLWHVNTLGSLTDGLRHDLAQAEALTERGDWARARELTADASRRWDEGEIYLHITLDHETTDQISVSFAEVAEFLEHQETGEYSAANARLMEQLELLGTAERPLLENLL